MAHPAEYYQEWLEHDGKKVKIDGINHILRVSTHMAIYPYRHEVISVQAEVADKSTKYYRELKARYGDDWSTDVLDSDIVLQTEILCQLGEQA